MKVLIAVDGSTCAWHALAEAMRLLPLAGAEVHVIGVARPYTPLAMSPLAMPGEFVLAELAAQHRAEAQVRVDAAVRALAAGGVGATGVLRDGDPAGSIVAYADFFRPDLVVVGSHGHGALGRLVLGSVSDAVAHRWPGAVMVVRPDASAVPAAARSRDVASVMTRSPVCAQARDPVAVVAAMMRQHDIGFVPVLEGDALVGVVTDRDLALRVVADRHDPARLRVREACSPEPAWIAPEAPLVEAVRLMERRRVRRLVVMAGRTVVGVLSLGDLAQTEHRAADHALVEISRSPQTTAHGPA